jgi:hypothetical protein
MKQSARTNDAAAQPESKGSTAIILKDQDGNLQSIQLYLEGDDHLCDDCEALYTVFNKCVVWQCEVCGGGSAWIEAEVYAG